MARWATPEAWAAQRGAEVRARFGLALDALRPEGAVRMPDTPHADWIAAKCATLQPAVGERFLCFLEAAGAVGREHGVTLSVWDAARSLERQLALYRRGRTDKGPRVTYAIASAQGHVFGGAVDLCVRSRAGQPVFDLPTWYQGLVLPLAAEHGLESLYLAKGLDLPHIQVPLRDVPAAVRETARRLTAEFKRDVWKP